jgi:hypothetical protein
MRVVPSISSVGGSNQSEIENKDTSGEVMMKYLKDSGGIIPLLLLMMGAIVGLSILLLVVSC